jgi:hypothetical protein
VGVENIYTIFENLEKRSYFLKCKDEMDLRGKTFKLQVMGTIQDQMATSVFIPAEKT